jgi:hypothetical protein
MRTRSVIYCIGATLGICIPAHAQICAPFWSRLRPEPPASFSGLVSGYLTKPIPGGNDLFAYSVGPWQLFRLDDMSWTGIPLPFNTQTVQGGLRVLDDGRGSAFFAYGHSDPFGLAPYWSGRWNGTSWDRLPDTFYTGPAGMRPILSLDIGHGPQIFGTGYDPSGHAGVGVWNGTDWSPLGFGDFGQINHLVGFQGSLLVFGDFTQIGGVPAAGFARWDGQRFSALWPEPVQSNYTIRSCIFDDGTGPALFTNVSPAIGGVAGSGLHKWDGHAWSLVAGPLGAVSDLKVFDDGRGPALFMVKGYSPFAGLPPNTIVRYDGRAWEPLAPAITWGNGYLVPFDHPLGKALVVVSGRGTTSCAGGVIENAALWFACPNCYANCDFSEGPTRLNVNDFVCFINKYASLDPYANCNVDGVIDFNDFACFMTKFAQGCP